MTSMIDAALQYAKKGYSIFPCHTPAGNGSCSCGESDCKSVGKHPRTKAGHKEATTNKSAIEQWWDKWPDANIGLSIEPSGLLVIDPDRHPGKPDGVAALKELRMDKPLPGAISMTGGNGFHIIYKKPTGEMTSPAPGIDVKTKGYIIAPPSLHFSGKQYEWRKRRSLLELDLGFPPDWIITVITKKEKTPKENAVKKPKKDEQPITTTDELLLNIKRKYPDSYGEQIVERCNFMRNWANDAPNLSEPEWFKGIGVLSSTVDAGDVIHKYSRKYPGYSFKETQEKIEHWKRDSEGPATCEGIQKECGDTLCRACPYNGHIVSPIVLGYSTRPLEKAKNIMPFPVEFLPGVFKEFALSASVSLQCPVDYIACSLLAVASILIGGKRQIQLGPNWRQFSNIWLAMVGTPSAKKSPALDAVLKPLRVIEQELHDAYMKNFALYETALEEYKAEVTAINRAKKNNKEATDIETEVSPIKPEKPVRKRLTTSDSTVEALAEKLSENPHGMALVFDELSAWMRSMNQYRGGRGADRSHFLSMWSNATMTIDRKGKEPIVVPSPFLTIFGGIQPGILHEMTDNGINDGTKERFLFGCPPQNNEEPNRGVAIPPQVESDIELNFRRIFLGRQNKLITIELSEEALEVFLLARREWHHIMQSEEFLPHLEAYYVKMSNYIGRFALILHEMKRACAITDRDIIDEQSMIEAKMLADYFLAHAQIALKIMMQTQEEQRVEKAIKWIMSKALKVISPRDLITNKVAGCRKSQEAKSMLKCLQDYGYGYWVEEKSRLIFF